MRTGLRELMFLIVLLGIPAVAWYTHLKPAQVMIAQIQAEEQGKRQKLLQLESATKHISDLGGEIDKLTEAISLFEAKLPAEKEVDVILKHITQLAARHGLKARSVRAEKANRSARYSELPLKMVIHGDFDGYYSYMLDLERLSRITRIPQMQLTKLNDGGEGQMEAQFTLTIFFESQDAGGSLAGAQ